MDASNTHLVDRCNVIYRMEKNRIYKWEYLSAEINIKLALEWQLK